MNEQNSNNLTELSEPHPEPIGKKNKIFPLPISITKPFNPLYNSNNTTETEKMKEKDTNVSNPASSMNSARTDQPLLMTSCNMLQPNLPQKLVISNKTIKKPNDNIKKKKNQSPETKNKLLMGSRADSHGFPIIRGGKNHKIAFKDDLVNVYYVESYKKYNIESTNATTKSCLKCLCTVF